MYEFPCGVSTSAVTKWAYSLRALPKNSAPVTELARDRSPFNQDRGYAIEVEDKVLRLGMLIFEHRPQGLELRTLVEGEDPARERVGLDLLAEPSELVRVLPRVCFQQLVDVLHNHVCHVLISSIFDFLGR